MSDEAEKAGAAARLRSAVEMLSLPGSEALTRRGLARADGLAIEFDAAYTVFVARLSELPGDTQIETLQELDGQLQSMSDPSLEWKWTAQSMKTDADWQAVRTMARAVLAAFGWAGGSSP